MTDTISMHDVVRVPTGELHQAPWNANKVGKAMMDKIRRSLRHYGSVENNVVRPAWCVGARTRAEVAARKTAQIEPGSGGYEVLSGNHRLLIYREEGVLDVPCVVLELPDPEAKVLAQALNRTRGEDDPKRLRALLQDVLVSIPPADVASLLPQREGDLTALLNRVPSPGEGAAADPGFQMAPGEGAPVASKPGQVYQLGPHVLVCGSAIEEEHVDMALAEAGGKAAVMFADPPYNVGYDYADSVPDNRPPEDYKAFVDRFMEIGSARTEMQIVTPGKGNERLYNWRDWMVWFKEFANTSGSFYSAQVTEPVLLFGTKPKGLRYFTDHLKFKSDRWPELRKYHPCPKPVELLEALVRPMTMPGQWVLDPFSGSGTTLIACARTKRRCAAVELSPAYCDVTRRRWTAWAKAAGVDAGPGQLEPLGEVA